MTDTQIHIFVVDDDPAFLKAVTRLIHAFGYDVTACGSISDLCGYVPFPPVSCVLADILLDGESGLDIPDRLASVNETAPVLFMSATDDEATIRAAGNRSVLPCLNKPIEAIDLRTALEVVSENSPPQSNPNLRRAEL